MSMTYRRSLALTTAACAIYVGSIHAQVEVDALKPTSFLPRWKSKRESRRPIVRTVPGDSPPLNLSMSNEELVLLDNDNLKPVILQFVREKSSKYQFWNLVFVLLEHDEDALKVIKTNLVEKAESKNPNSVKYADIKRECIEFTAQLQKNVSVKNRNFS